MPKGDRSRHSHRERGAVNQPQGAPRGLLRYYVLHRIALNPSHGYEILQNIENKTEGAWRPGAGSIYPILKELEANGFIKVENAPKGETAQQVYSVTAKGAKYLEGAKETFVSAGQKWSAMRRIFVELMDSASIERFLIRGVAAQFDMVKELVSSNMDKIQPNELEYLLKEYSLLLERQLDWSNQTLRATGNAARGRATKRSQGARLNR